MTRTAEIPKPPSLNRLFRNVRGRGRAKTAAYEAWLIAAMPAFRAMAPTPGPYTLTIALGPRAGSDLDNYAKAISDALVSARAVPDDRHCQRLTLEWADDLPHDRARVSLAPAPKPEPKAAPKREPTKRRKAVLLSKLAALAVQSIAAGRACDPPVTDAVLAEMIAAQVARAVYAGGERFVILTPEGYEVAESVGRAEKARPR